MTPSKKVQNPNFGSLDLEYSTSPNSSSLNPQCPIEPKVQTPITTDLVVYDRSLDMCQAPTKTAPFSQDMCRLEDAPQQPKYDLFMSVDSKAQQMMMAIQNALESNRKNSLAEIEEDFSMPKLLTFVGKTNETAEATITSGLEDAVETTVLTKPVKVAKAVVDETMCPLVDSMCPANDNTTSVDETIVPVTILPVKKATVPVKETKALIDETTMCPLIDTMCPANDNTTLANDSIISVDETILPVDELVYEPEVPLTWTTTQMTPPIQAETQSDASPIYDNTTFLNSESAVSTSSIFAAKIEKLNVSLRDIADSTLASINEISDATITKINSVKRGVQRINNNAEEVVTNTKAILNDYAAQVTDLFSKKIDNIGDATLDAAEMLGDATVKTFDGVSEGASEAVKTGATMVDVLSNNAIHRMSELSRATNKIYASAFYAVNGIDFKEADDYLVSLGKIAKEDALASLQKAALSAVDNTIGVVKESAQSYHSSMQAMCDKASECVENCSKIKGGFCKAKGAVEGLISFGKEAGKKFVEFTTESVEAAKVRLSSLRRDVATETHNSGVELPMGTQDAVMDAAEKLSPNTCPAFIDKCAATNDTRAFEVSAVPELQPVQLNPIPVAPVGFWSAGFKNIEEVTLGKIFPTLFSTNSIYVAVMMIVAISVGALLYHFKSQIFRPKASRTTKMWHAIFLVATVGIAIAGSLLFFKVIQLPSRVPIPQVPTPQVPVMAGATMTASI